MKRTVCSVVAFALMLGACGQATEQPADEEITRRIPQFENDDVGRKLEVAHEWRDTLGLHYARGRVTPRSQQGKEYDGGQSGRVSRDSHSRRFEILQRVRNKVTVSIARGGLPGLVWNSRG